MTPEESFEKYWDELGVSEDNPEKPTAKMFYLQGYKDAESVSAKEKLMDYERNYSHSHCWQQGLKPACGQSLASHKQCCLCDGRYNH